MQFLKRSLSMPVLFFLIAIFITADVVAHAESAGEVVETFTTKSPAKSTESIEDIRAKKAAIAGNLNITVPADSSETISLPPLDYEKIIKEDKQNQGYQKELRIGVHRSIDQSFDGKWRVFQRADGKYSWRVVINALGAGFLRPHFKKFPSADAEVYLYGTGGVDSLEGPIKKPDVYEGSEFWGPIIKGDYLYIEVVQSSDTVAPDLYIDTISHGYRDPVSKAITDSNLKESSLAVQAAWCELDISCYSSWVPYGRAVAMMAFEKNGSSYRCTGALVMDQGSTYRNWFLTANHCISDNAAANTLITYFSYTTPWCNSSSFWYNFYVSGATFRVGSQNSDFTLLELAGSHPISDPVWGAHYLGWTTADIPDGASVVGIHHPQTDQNVFQRISFGNGGSMPTDPPQFTLGGPTYSSANFWAVLWSNGTIEGGSSGSPLLNANGQIVGQALAGPKPQYACTTMNIGIYGKFSVSWNNGLKNYLSSAPPTSPVYRFYNTQTGTHFFTISESEKNSVIQNYPQFHFEGAVFYAYQTQQSGASPVYRFYNTLTGTHFYTISESEKNSVMQNLPQFHFEGPVFYAFQSQQSGTSPVYRFFNTTTGTHFYTISESEKNNILSTLPQYHLDGVGFYTFPAQ